MAASTATAVIQAYTLEVTGDPIVWLVRITGGSNPSLLPYPPPAGSGVVLVVKALDAASQPYIREVTAICTRRRLRELRGGRRELTGHRSRLDRRQDVVALDVDEVVGHQVDHPVSGCPERLGVHVAEPDELLGVEVRSVGSDRAIVCRHRPKATPS